MRVMEAIMGDKTFLFSFGSPLIYIGNPQIAIEACCHILIKLLKFPNRYCGLWDFSSRCRNRSDLWSTNSPLCIAVVYRHGFLFIHVSEKQKVAQYALHFQLNARNGKVGVRLVCCYIKFIVKLLLIHVFLKLRTGYLFLQETHI